MAGQDSRQMAIEILKATHSGNDLSDKDLDLVHNVLRNVPTEDDIQRLFRLHSETKAGKYPNQDLFGLEHLRRDPEGNLFYKGIRIMCSNPRWLASNEAPRYLAELHGWLVRQERKGAEVSYAAVMFRDMSDELPQQRRPVENRDAMLTKIALEHCFVETLEERKSDSLDFHDISVTCLKSALEAAFEAGRTMALAQGQVLDDKKPSVLAGLRENRDGLPSKPPATSPQGQKKEETR